MKKRISICLAALLLLSLCACTGGMSGTGRNDATGPDGNYVAPNGETGGMNTDGNANGTDGNTDGERDERFDDNREATEGYLVQKRGNKRREHDYAHCRKN